MLGHWFLKCWCHSCRLLFGHFQFALIRRPNTPGSYTILFFTDELPGSVGAQYATGEEWRHNSRKNEEMEPKQKQNQAVDMTGDGSKI